MDNLKFQIKNILIDCFNELNVGVNNHLINKYTNVLYDFIKVNYLDKYKDEISDLNDMVDILESEYLNSKVY